jgi:hypothetical protein
MISDAGNVQSHTKIITTVLFAADGGPKSKREFGGFK